MRGGEDGFTSENVNGDVGVGDRVEILITITAINTSTNIITLGIGFHLFPTPLTAHRCQRPLVQQ